MVASGGAHVGQDGDLLPEEHAAIDFYNKYDPKEVLGRGLSSVVRKCIHRKSGIPYAVKIMDVSADIVDADGLDLRQQTKREADILQRVSGHEHIITLHDVFECSTFIFLVFELCPNGELFDYLTRKVRLSEKKVRVIMRQICMAVEHCHSLGVMHRDLKPENILLDENFNIKLTDFGFAKVLTPEVRLYEVCGTPGYLAPEMLKSGVLEKKVAPGYSFEIDNWACGVIMYTLLVGCPPFWHRRQLTMIRQIMNAKYSFSSPEWDGITDESKDLISKFLQEFPEKRMTVSEALKHSFFKAKNDNEDEMNAKRTLSNVRPNFKPRRMFRVGLVSVQFLIRFKRLKFTPEPFSLGQARLNPYMMRMFRKTIDGDAFRVYQHWVKRGDGQNRAAIFEHFPKRELAKQHRNAKNGAEAKNENKDLVKL